MEARLPFLRPVASGTGDCASGLICHPAVAYVHRHFKAGTHYFHESIAIDTSVHKINADW